MNIFQTLLALSVSLFIFFLPGPPFYDKASESTHRFFDGMVLVAAVVFISSLVWLFILLGRTSS